MVNFHNPSVVAADSLALLKFWHAVAGLYIWEFLTTLDFEWSFIQGGRRYRWTIWIYSLTRIAALATVIVNLTLLNVTTPIDCQVSVILEMVPGYLALAAASLLLVLRIIAIWENNTIAVTIASGIWGINSAFLIQGIARLRYAREVPGGPCITLNIQATKLTMIVAFIADILLLIMMLVGLFLGGYHQRDALYTGQFLWNQGIIWLFLAIISGILPTVFVCLNLNDSLSVIFQIPWLITMSIAATRMYRALDEFFSDVIYSPHVPNINSGNTTGTWGTPAIPIPLNGMGAQVQTTRDQHLTSQRSQHSLGRNMDRQLHGKPHGLV